MLLKTDAKSRLGVESLESRLNLAAVSLSVNEADGDLVRITASLPGAARPPLDATDVVLGAVGGIVQLKLTELGFENATIKIATKANSGGDGEVLVESIDATGRNLNRVIVGGVLLRITAGAATSNGRFSGIRQLKVKSMGFGAFFSGSTVRSVITGRLGVLQIAGDFQNTSIQVTPAAPSRPGVIGKAFIGGDIIGGPEDGTGVIAANVIKKLRVGGGIRGGSGAFSGAVLAPDVSGNGGLIGDARVGGSVVGGNGDGSGTISSEKIRHLVVKGDLVGGGGFVSGAIRAEGAINQQPSPGFGRLRIEGNIVGGSGAGSASVEATAADVIRVGGNIAGGSGQRSANVSSLFTDVIRVGGSVLGGDGSESGKITVATAHEVNVGKDVIGSADNSGVITSFAMINSLVIGGDLVGGSVTGNISKQGAGAITSLGGIERLSIRGSLIAGTDSSTGTLLHCGSILSVLGIGSIRIAGGVIGTSSNPASIIVERGRRFEKPASGFDVAIGRLDIGGTVEFAQVLAGFGAISGGVFSSITPVNADASIGAVRVGGNWVSSDIVAGCIDLGPPGFGVGDEVQAVDDTPLLAGIASIVIGGTVSGSAQAGDHFGFVAQQIDKVRIRNQPAALTAGPSNDNVLVQGTTDVRSLEVP